MHPTGTGSEKSWKDVQCLVSANRGSVVHAPCGQSCYSYVAIGVPFSMVNVTLETSVSCSSGHSSEVPS